MVPKFMIVAAVPFCTTRLQANLNRSIVRKGAEMFGMNNDNTQTFNKTRRKMQNLSLKEKLELRRQRNKVAAQSSREKVKIQQNLLEQRLSELKYEKMKLLLENESLKNQNTQLKEENGSLKLLEQDQKKQFVNDESSEEATFRHAWFVNIPLLKEWVVPRILFIIIMSIWESLKHSSLVLNLWAPQFRIHQNLSTIKSLMFPIHPQWKLMSPQTSCLQSFMILNG